MSRTARLMGIAFFAVAAQGCVSTVFNDLRAPHYGAAAKVEFYCAPVPSNPTELSEKMNAAYAKGWRVVMTGRTRTSFLGIFSTEDPLFCVERVSEAGR